MVVEAQEGGALPRDTNKRTIQVASKIQMRDGTTPTAVESPFTTSSASAQEFVPPQNALTMTVVINDADARIGDNSTLDGTANDGYFPLGDGTSITVPVANGDSVYLMRDAGVDVEIGFYYEIA